MSTAVRTMQCYPRPLDLGPVMHMRAPRPDHENCPGSDEDDGALGAWHCPCPCHGRPALGLHASRAGVTVKWPNDFGMDTTYDLAAYGGKLVERAAALLADYQHTEARTDLHVRAWALLKEIDPTWREGEPWRE